MPDLPANYPVSSRAGQSEPLRQLILNLPISLVPLVACPHHSFSPPGPTSQVHSQRRERQAQVAPTRRGGKGASRSAAATCCQRRSGDHLRSHPGQSKSFRHTFSKTASSLRSLTRRSQTASHQQALIQSSEGSVSRHRRHDRGTRPDRARPGQRANPKQAF